MKSVIKNLDRNSDHALSRSDLNTYWDRLGEKSGGTEGRVDGDEGMVAGVHSTFLQVHSP